MNESPFDLKNEAAYRRWREQKLDGYPTDAQELIVEVGAAEALTPAERGAIQARKPSLHQIYVPQDPLPY